MGAAETRDGSSEFRHMGRSGRLPRPIAHIHGTVPVTEYSVKFVIRTHCCVVDENAFRSVFSTNSVQKTTLTRVPIQIQLHTVSLLLLR